MPAETSKKQYYDYVFIGTSMISAFEATYQRLCGRSVLMIDQQPEMGGAWTPLTLFGVNDVENAIHYFLPDPDGFRFMREVLGWRVIKSQGKYRIFKKPVLGLRKIAYDNPFACFFLSVASRSSFTTCLKDLFSGFAKIVTGNRKSSYYVAGGCAEMLPKAQQLLSQTGVETKFRTFAEEITFSPESGFATLLLREGDVSSVVECKHLNISHGSKIKSIRGPSGPLPIEEKIHPRPAMHLLVEDKEPTKILEAILVGDDIIKYAHDVSRYTREAAQLAERHQKIFVLALQHNVEQHDALQQQIFDRLRAAKVVGPQARLLESKWWDIFLPSLEDSDLEMIQRALSPCVSILKTENFARGVGLYSNRWRSKILSFEQGATA